MNLSRHTLPQVPAPSRVFAKIDRAEAVTRSVIGIVTESVWAGEGVQGSIYKKRIDAITVFIRPHLFILDLRK